MVVDSVLVYPTNRKLRTHRYSMYIQYVFKPYRIAAIEYVPYVHLVKLFKWKSHGGISDSTRARVSPAWEATSPAERPAPPRFPSFLQVPVTVMVQLFLPDWEITKRPAE